MRSRITAPAAPALAAWSVPRRAPNSELRPRDYLTEKEIERLQEVARKRSRYATMILIAYRHGLRASELCGLRCDQIDLNSGDCMSAEPRAGSITFIL
jgi:type 1 fimbriae regulatory protein FimB/type 1 fimbriae regulatory protein FimE